MQNKLPKAECELGYPKSQVEDILAARQIEPSKFWGWMHGQTMTICDGREYSYEDKAYKPTKCADNPHSGVVYVWDMATFLAGLPPLD